MQAAALPVAATGQPTALKGRAGAQARGGLNRGRPASEAGRLLLAERRRARDEVGRQRDGCQMLRGDVGKTMAAVARQLLLGRIRRRALVEVQSPRQAASDPGETKLAAGAMDQRNQQANRQQQDERQPAKPASGMLLLIWSH